MRTRAQEAAFEKLLQRGRGKLSIYVILVKGEVHATKHTFCRRSAAHLEKVTAHHKKHILPGR